MKRKSNFNFRLRLVKFALITFTALTVGASASGTNPSTTNALVIPESVEVVRGFVTEDPPLTNTTQVLLDTFTGADFLRRLDCCSPRTYMGNGWANTALPIDTTSITVTGFTLYIGPLQNQSYANVSARIKLWNTYNGPNNPIFSNGSSVVVTDLGPRTFFAHTTVAVNITLQTPITLIGGRGTGLGFGQNFQANGADTNDLTSVVASRNAGTYPVGQVISPGTSPKYGYYRNQSGRTDFNFSTTDGFFFSSGNELAQGVAIIIYGTVNTGEPPPPPPNRKQFDFDGDGKTDIGIYRPSTGEWWINRSSIGSAYAAQFGISSDKITPLDFTGDGKADIAFWRSSTGFWFVLRSEDSTFFSFPYGTNGDLPATGDYDNDGKGDAAVFRPSNSTWFVRRSTDGGSTIQQFGQSGDVPVAADYDGDGKTDMAIFRPSSGQWWLNRSTAGVIAFQFGNSSDKCTPGDFTGDGKADVALWRPSTGFWFVLRSEDQSFFSFPYGTNGDAPAPGDYDGDGKHDAAVFRTSNNTWFIRRSTDGGSTIQGFGQAGDRAVPNAYVVP